MIIFDLDGTLWDSGVNTAKSWTIAAQRKGYDVEMTADEVRSIMGMTMDQIEEVLYSRYNVTSGSEMFVTCMNYENEYLAEHGGDLFPNVRETLEKLHNEGYKLAIVSNCQEGYVPAFMKSMDMGRYFCDYEEWGRTGLSKAENIRLVMKRNNVEEAVYIGDIQNDANSAAEAGIACIAAEYGFGHIENPTARFDDISQLPEIIAKMWPLKFEKCDGSQQQIEEIVDIYNRTHDVEEAGLTTIGWIRDIYPTEQIVLDALERGDMYVCKRDGKIVASGIINRIQVDVYEGANWKYEAPDDEIMVLHTLVVDPERKHDGIGSAFVEFYEELARENGCTVLRIDTNANNLVARSLYAKLGYREAEAVPTVFNGIPGIDLMLIEKKL